MIIDDQKLFERIEAFTKYARFISNKFGVTVVLDGTEANTNGSIINLPNVAGMSADEVDFLYGVLLHEVGHIRHTNFDKSLFAKIKTANHFMCFNAVEDARMENALMDEYAGAVDIFEDLYHKFAIDDRFMERIFGKKGDTHWLYAAGIYAHYQLLKLPKKLPINQALGKEAQKVYNLPAKAKLDSLLNTYGPKLKTTEDSLDLANKIYNTLFEDTTDRSDKNELPKQDQAVADAMQQAANIKKHLEEKDAKLDDLRKEIRELRKSLQEQREKVAPYRDELSKVNEDLYRVEDTKDIFDDQQSYQKDLSEAESKAKSAQDKADKKAQEAKDLEKQIQDLKDKIAEQEKLKANEQDYKKRVQINKQIDKLESKTKTLNKAIKMVETVRDNAQERADDWKKEAQEIQKAIDQLKEQAKKVQATPEELAKAAEALRSQQHDLENKKRRAEDGAFEKRMKLEEKIRQLQDAQGAVTKNAFESLQQLQQQCEKAGLPIEISPSFKPIPGWDGANDAQKEFDSEATANLDQPVVNGGLTGSNIRDVLVLLEKGQHGLQTIDLTELFKKQHEVSKLESFNDLAKVKNSSEDSKLNESTSRKDLRKHVPLTTRFDTVKPSSQASGNELSKLRVLNADEIARIKRIFRAKLHYQKKIRHKGSQEEGDLDNRSMWKLASRTGDDIYEIPHPMKVNQVVASVAIDISGSIEKKLNEREKLLQEVALLISEGLKDCFVRHEVCGYHAPVCDEMRSMPGAKAFNRSSNNLETVVYKGFNEKGNNGIENLEVQCTDNSDGESLRIIGGRLLRERARRRILFVVLDGKPFLSGADSSLLDADLKDTLEWLAKNKIEVYALGLDKAAETYFGNRFFHVVSPQSVVKFAQEKLL